MFRSLRFFAAALVLTTSPFCMKCKAVQRIDSASTILQAVEPMDLSSMIQEPESSTLRSIPESDLGETLRLATYNIQNLTDGVDDGWGRTSRKTTRQVEGAARVINSIQPDILVTQETENMAIVKRLNGLLDHPFRYLYVSQFSSSKRDEKLNISLLSRLPLLEVRELDFTAVPNPPIHLSRGAMRFQVDLGGNRRLLGYGVHLKSNYGEYEDNVLKRLTSTRIIRDDADALIAAHPELDFEVIVLGDTNVDPDLDPWKDDPSFTPFEGWMDLWRGVPMDVRTTLDSRMGDPEMYYDPVAFDRMIVSPELRESPWSVSLPTVVRMGVDTNNVYVGAGENEIHVSDHYPVYIDLQR